MLNNIRISIVTPVYKAEKIIPELVKRIKSSVSLISENFEIILVEDCGPDNSWKIISQECAIDTRVKGIKLSRNFGQHPAIMAGLKSVKGEWIVVMDCDLQDVPEEIGKLYEKALEGYDYVVARRVQRKDSFFKRLSSKMFSIVFNYLSGIKTDKEVANFGIYHKKVIDAVLEMSDFIKSFPLFVNYVGFNGVGLPVNHSERLEGKSSYTIFKLFAFAFNSIIAFSNKPLMLFMRLGLLMTLFSFAIGLYFIYLYILGNIIVPGYASIIVSLFFLSGIIICAIGVVGVYLGKVFEQIKGRRPYIEDLRINI